jgi:CAAX protease family protein
MEPDPPPSVPIDPVAGATGAAEAPATAAPMPPPAPPSTLGTLALGFVAPLVTGLVAAVLVLFVAACLPGAPRTRELVSWALRSATGLGAVMLLQNALLALWAWRLAQGRGLPARAWLRLLPARLTSLDLLLLLVLAAGVFGLGALVALIGRQLGLPADPRVVERVVETFRTAPGVSWLFLALALGAGPGFGEEIWIRGYVLRVLEQRFRTRVAILVSAVLFALLHLDPTHMLFALPFGLVFGWLTVRTNSILPGILCHAVVNSGVNLVRAIEVRKPGYLEELQPLVIQPGDVWMLVTMISAGAVAGLWLERRFRTSTPSSSEAPSQPAPGVEGA